MKTRTMIALLTLTAWSFGQTTPVEVKRIPAKPKSIGSDGIPSPEQYPFTKLIGALETAPPKPAPKAVAKLVTDSWPASVTSSNYSTLLDELCFRYEYDYRDRMSIKKVPGAAEVYIN